MIQQIKKYFFLFYEGATMRHTRRRVLSTCRCSGHWIGAIFTIFLLIDFGYSQTHLRQRDFLNLGAVEGYINYGRTEYEPYPELISARNRYDRLGNFQMRGHRTFTWELQRPGYSELATRSEQYLGWFNNLVVMNDTYRGWNMGVTVGEDIRTKLTDLTFYDPRFYGIRMDGASADNRFTLLLSQGGSQATQSPNPKFSTFQGSKERSSVLLFGGHWETQLGSALKLGATYFNQHMLDTFNDQGSFIRGDTPYSMLGPSYITVIVEDDNPDGDNIPAVVYNVGIEVQAESMGNLVRFSSLEGDQDYDVSMIPVVDGGATNAEGGREVSGPGAWYILSECQSLFYRTQPNTRPTNALLLSKVCLLNLSNLLQMLQVIIGYPLGNSTYFSMKKPIIKTLVKSMLLVTIATLTHLQG